MDILTLSNHDKTAFYFISSQKEFSNLSFLNERKPYFTMFFIQKDMRNVDAPFQTIAKEYYDQINQVPS